jgi:phosphoenolpyruvate-protein kinase (PTS system EI component)
VGGVRALLAREKVLREQLQAILRSTVGVRARIAVPFVTDTSELRRVKEILFEERLELRKAGASFQEKVAVGAVIETPAAVIGARDLARESDFLLIGLDSLVQHLLATDRENHALASSFITLHPMVLRALRDVVRACRELEKPLSVFGITSRSRLTLPFVIGAGLRDFCVPPGNLREFLAQLSELDSRSARRSTTSAAALSSQAEARSLVDGYHHGHARS